MMRFAVLDPTEKSKGADSKEVYTLLFSVQTAQKSMNTACLTELKGG
jgi:hypothetical protein